MTRPVLGLLVTARAPAPLASLLRVLSAWCRPRLPGRGAVPVMAWMATSPEAAQEATTTRGAQPVAVWVEDEQALGRAEHLDGPLPVLLTSVPAVAAAGDHVILVPTDGLDATRALPLPPFLRACWRDRFGLPDDLVVTVGRAAPGSLPDELVPTAMALASAVVIEAGAVPRLLEAMAWAGPCVTDPVTAARVGGRASVELVVTEPAQLARDAVDIGRDWRRGTEIGTAGRRLVERAHDLHRPALDVALRLGLADPVGLAGRMTTVLDEFWTEPAAEIRRRTDAALAFGR